MMNKITSVALLAGMLALGANAETYTWTGSAGGAWNTPANWKTSGGTTPSYFSPTADDTLIISGTTEAKPLVFTSATTVASRISLPSSGYQVISNATGTGTIKLTGQITGQGGIMCCYNGSGYVEFSGANSFSGGVYRKEPGQIKLMSANGFGTGLVTIGDGSAQGTRANLAGLYIDQNFTVANNFWFGLESWTSWNGWWGGKAGSTVHFTGVVQYPKQTRTGSSGTFYYDNEIQIGGGFLTKTGASFHFMTPVKRCNGAQGFMYMDNSYAYLHFHASNNDFNRFNLGNGVTLNIYTYAVNAFPNSYFLVSTSAHVPITMYGGFDQIIPSVQENSGAKCTIDLTTAANGSEPEKPATMFFNLTADSVFRGTVSRMASLGVDSASSKALTVSGATFNTEGGIIVKRGSMIFNGDQSKFSSLNSIEVAAGAALSFVEDMDCPTTLKELRLTSGSNFTIADDREIRVDKLYVNGALMQETKVWTEADGIGLRGMGKIVTLRPEPPTKSATWTGEGGSDTKSSNPNNWGGTPADLESSATIATFASGGTVATFDRAASLKGIVLNSLRDFSIESASGEEISLYEGGIVASKPASDRTYAINSPLRFVMDDDVALAWESNQLHMCVNGGIRSSAGVKVRQLSTFVAQKDDVHRSRLELSGAKDDFAGVYTVTNSDLCVHGEALNGNPKGELVIDDRPYHGSKVWFENVTINKKVTVIQAPNVGSVGNGSDVPWHCVPGTTNVFTGPVDIIGNHFRIPLEQNTFCLFEGGFSLSGGCFLVPSGTGWMKFTKKPITNLEALWLDGNSGNVLLGVSSNRISRILMGGYVLELGAEDPVIGCTRMNFFGSGKIIMNGHSMPVGYLEYSPPDYFPKDPPNLTIESDKYAVLDVNQGIHSLPTNMIAFVGGASFRKTGSDTMYMSRINSSTGTVETAGTGSLVFMKGSSWLLASSVTVNGGTLQLDHNQVFSGRTDLHLGTDSVINLNFMSSDGDQYVNRLYDAEGKTLAFGRYCSMENSSVPGAKQVAWIKGNGVLNVRGRVPSMIRLR